MPLTGMKALKTIHHLIFTVTLWDRLHGFGNQTALVPMLATDQVCELGQGT